MGIEGARIGLEWVSAAEGPRFVQAVSEFSRRIQGLGPVSAGRSLERQSFLRKVEAARLALEGPKFRMALAKQARDANNAGKHGEFPSEERLMAGFAEEMNVFETFLHLREKERGADELAALMNLSSEQIAKNMDTLKKRKIEWRV